VLDTVKPGKTIKVRIANVPKLTNIGDEVFSEKTFLNNSFIVLFYEIKDGWVQSSN